MLVEVCGEGLLADEVRLHDRVIVIDRRCSLGCRANPGIVLQVMMRARLRAEIRQVDPLWRSVR
jgi:hypothetical protein